MDSLPEGLQRLRYSSSEHDRTDVVYFQAEWLPHHENDDDYERQEKAFDDAVNHFNLIPEAKKGYLVPKETQTDGHNHSSGISSRFESLKFGLGDFM